MSPGNAHPYSWSSIINGHFDESEIANAGFPGVNTYLRANKNALGIGNSTVTHIWTQDKLLSSAIARSSRIDHVIDNIEDMIGEVDAVMLLRDDAENHVAMSKPFIERGVPIFIDKPLATNNRDLDFFKEEAEKGKLIMSCSSMRYSKEYKSFMEEPESLGKIELITAVGKKDWLKYGVHMIEGIFTLMGDKQPVSVKNVGEYEKDVVCLEFENGPKVVIHLFMDIALTFQISVFGKQGWRIIEMKDWFSMFRDNIAEFLYSVEENRLRIPFYKTENIIRTLIAARESLEQNGKSIYLENNQPA